jgi:hypothetical protein
MATYAKLDIFQQSARPKYEQAFQPFAVSAVEVDPSCICTNTMNAVAFVIHLVKNQHVRLLISQGHPEWGLKTFYKLLQEQLSDYTFETHSQDDFMMKDGRYVFDKKKQIDALKGTQSRVMLGLHDKSQKKIVIAGNVNYSNHQIRTFDTIAASRRCKSAVIRILPETVDLAITLGEHNEKKIPANVFERNYILLQNPAKEDFESIVGILDFTITTPSLASISLEPWVKM